MLAPLRLYLMRHSRAFTLVELLVVIGIIALLIAILLPTLNRARETANRAKCASNLRTLGQAFALYAHENKGNYPRTFYDPAAALTDAVPPFVQRGASAASPFGGTSGFVGRNNITAAMFLLIRTQDITPESFICPSASQMTRDNFGGGANSAKDRSNFTSIRDNLSYSYANPYPTDALAQGGYQLGKNLRADFAVSADVNAGRQGSYDVTMPQQNSPTSEMRKANSPNHKGDGQNVLYGDGHVDWAHNPFCGRQFDNIYTVSGSSDGTTPTSQVIADSPKWIGDSVLLPALGP
jgi:prepilin-type N-terminal cleavage/methylation domain-containing protein